MTLARPIPETQDPAQKRLELELLLQQPIPSPDQLRAALQLLDAVPEIASAHWQTLKVMPLRVDAERLDIAVPSSWGEPE